MRYVDEFRDPQLIRQAAEEVRRLVDPGRHYRIMEVCGGHTHAIYRFALADLLPPNIELVHGPGCPVCVLPMGRLDDGMSIAEQHGAIFTTLGDVMRVPGRRGSPLEYQARGVDVRMVYSPLDALRLAQQNPHRHVVFFAIGFETTAPSTALTLQRAKQLGVENFSVHCNHVTIIPAIRAILDSPDMRLDAFIGPGHVSTVIGCRPYGFVARDYGKPLVVSGFEPLDLLQSIIMVLRCDRRAPAADHPHGAAERRRHQPRTGGTRLFCEARLNPAGAAIRSFGSACHQAGPAHAGGARDPPSHARDMRTVDVVLPIRRATAGACLRRARQEQVRVVPCSVDRDVS